MKFIDSILYTSKIYKFLLLFGIGGCCIMVIGVLTTDSKYAETKKETESINTKKITIGQYQLRDSYKWNDVILWIESKDNFEKAYGDSLRKTGHVMLFTKDPMCTGPFGETGDWECEKMCFKYIVPEENPNVINEIAEKSKGKTLVVIGSLFKNGTEFGGSAYWCENKK